MNKVILFLVSTALLSAVCQSLSYPTLRVDSFKKVFDAAKPYNELSSAFYSVRGLSLLGEKAQNSAELCNLIKTKVDKANIESVFNAASLAGTIENCQLNAADFQDVLTAASSSLNVAELYYYSEIATIFKQPIDLAKLKKSLLDGLKKDNSILNQGFSLHIATLFDIQDKTFYNNIEDILEQADELDNKYLQFEGGIATTGIILDGIFKLASKFKQMPAKFTQDRLTKFTNYLTSKRHVSNLRSSFYLLNIAVKLEDNQFSIPVIVNRVSQVSVTTEWPNVLVGLTNILGRPVAKTEFTIQAESSLFSGKRALSLKSSDGSVFDLKALDGDAAAGFYAVTLQVATKNADKRFVVLNNKVDVKVMTKAEVSDVRVGAADREQLTPKIHKLEPGKELKDKLEADQNSKIYVKFFLKTNGKPIDAQQTFVKFTEAKTGREVIFLAEKNANTNEYSCEVDLSTNGKSFSQLSGVYSVQLIVSDALISNPQVIPLAKIKIQIGDSVAADAKASLFTPLPEIKHMFRPAEPRPSKLVSTVFSALCAAPFALLIILWLSMGVNFSNFKFSLSGILFHVLLAGVFGLFYCYWSYLNMFQTLYYLMFLVIGLFVTGKPTLSALATKKEKTN